MYSKPTKKDIERVTDAIVKHYKPEKIILFGSYAWGKPHKDSDLDIFVVKNTRTPLPKRIEALDRIFSRREFPMDFLVYTPAQTKRRLEMGDFFVKDIVTKGRILYDAETKKRV